MAPTNEPGLPTDADDAGQRSAGATASPTISIVTPVLNASETLLRCLDSVASSGAPLIEHIVVDGNSNDGSRELLRERESGFLRVIDAPAAGIADAFNRGILAAKGEWIGIINADDWYEPLAIEGLLPMMREGDAILHGRMRLHNTETGVNRESGPLDYQPDKHFRPWERMPAQHPTCFVPRAVYDRVGLYSPCFSLAMDYDFLLRCHLHDVPFRYVPEIIVNFSRGGASSIAGDRARRQVMAAQMIQSGHIAGPLRLYLHDRWRSRIRRIRRRLLRRPRV